MKARLKGINVTEFFEPDLGNVLTAITLEPSILSKKLCSNLPLILKHNKAIQE